MTNDILVVCSGNICRSPMAEAIFKARFKEAGLDIRITSAGTGAWHTGSKPDQRAVVASRLKGYDLCHIKAHQISDEDFENADLILVMDREVYSDTEALRPLGNETPIKLISEYGPEEAMAEVPDPYYTGKFNLVIAILEDCADGLIDQLRRERQ